MNKEKKQPWNVSRVFCQLAFNEKKGRKKVQQIRFTCQK